MPPSEATVIVTLVPAGLLEMVMHLRPLIEPDQVPTKDPPEVAHVLVPDADVLLGAVPTPPDRIKVAHSFANPVFSPIIAPAAAALRASRYLGIATAARMPTIATTIINSIRVKAFFCFLLLRRLLRRASWVRVCTAKGMIGSPHCM